MVGRFIIIKIIYVQKKKIPVISHYTLSIVQQKKKEKKYKLNNKSYTIKMFKAEKKYLT